MGDILQFPREPIIKVSKWRHACPEKMNRRGRSFHAVKELDINETCPDCGKPPPEWIGND